MAITGLRGTATVLRNLRGAVRNIQRDSRQGVRKAVLFVRREAQKLTPVKTSNLIGSYETDVFDTLRGPVGEIRVTAEYAVFVHEMPPGTQFRKRGAQSKFLESPLFNKQREILRLIQNETQI